MSDTIRFTINGQLCEAAGGEWAGRNLLDYLQQEQHLWGTKGMCHEGGCGACTVVATVPDPATGGATTAAVHSCLAPVLGCGGWSVTTVEGLGSRHESYHVIQDRLASYGGSQCGYCSPGMVMAMYGLTQGGGEWSQEDVEAHVDGGHLCRCTGYRPILDAFKSITTTDIESAHLARCPKTGERCTGRCSPKRKKEVRHKLLWDAAVQRDILQPLPKEIALRDGSTWHIPGTLEELYGILAGLAEGTQYRLVVGDTAKAVYKSDGPYSAYIYTRNIPEMSRVEATNEALEVGANVSISRLLQELKAAAQGLSGYSHLLPIVTTCTASVASTALRNLGSWGGNLATKMIHKDFCSDIFLALLVAGAVVTTGLPDGAIEQYTMEELLEVDLMALRGVILYLTLRPLPVDVIIRTFKVAARPSNTRAYLSAAFKLQVEAERHTVVEGSPVIAYGGVNPTFVRARATEAVLSGQSLEEESVLQTALATLASEVVPDDNPADASPEYKISLAQTLLYKTILGIVESEAGPTVASGATDLERPLTSAQQTFDDNSEFWPLGQPVPKLEGHIQCSGEAEFLATMPSLPREHFAHFVTTTQANARIVNVDPSPALAMPGVVTYLDVHDIPGLNNIHDLYSNVAQPLFAEGRTSYYGQAVGLVVARSWFVAWEAARKVVVTYDDVRPPVLTIEDALLQPLPPGQYDPFVEGDVQDGFASSTHIFEGEMRHAGQYHFYMENQVTLAVPRDDGLDVYASTQWASETQRSIGQVLDLQDNSITVTVKRIGGGFGGKINQGNIVATAAALAAHKVGHPVRISLDLRTNMTLYGGRDPFLCTYKVGVDEAGVLQAVQATITSDSGYVGTDANSSLSAPAVPSCYTCPNWQVTPQFVLTNTPCNTYTRNPGILEGVTLMETILEHVAEALGLDPLEVRRRNLMPDGASRRLNHRLIHLRSRIAGREATNLPKEIKIPKNLISDMIDQIFVSADVEQRKQHVAQFNQSNVWKKRGLSVMPVVWTYSVPMVYPYNALVSINARDGSVTVAHGGTEMGQGINTKIAQVAAYELGTPLEMVRVAASNTFTNANSSSTSGSTGSDIGAYCVSEACKLIRARLDSVEQEAGSQLPWPQLIRTAFDKGVDITQKYVNGPDEIKSYGVFGVACTEVELDVLTGQYLILRTDILEDAGMSMSPLVDVGQIEGAFVMGQGLFTSERLAFDPTTGRKLSDTTWNYWVPTAHDIPVDLRVSLVSKTPNPVGVLSSKVTAEPAVALAYTVLLALRQAITSARSDAGTTTTWFNIDAPFTVEKLQQLCLVDTSRLTIH